MAAPLQTLGFDSLTLRALSARLAESGARVEATEIFGAGSLDEVAALAAGRTDQSEPAAPADGSGRAAGQSGQCRAVRAVRAGRVSGGQQPAARAEAQEARDVPVPAAPPYPAAEVKPRQATGALAVVGMSGRYPGAPDLAAFLANLREGRDTAGPVPKDRWDTVSSADDVHGHFLTGVDRFDPEFFGLSTYESALVDPQERLFLETAVEALEDAGALGERLDALEDDAGEPRSVGVFVGVTSSDYQKVGVETWGLGNRTVPAGHYWSIANRVSYLLDLRGPSQPVDTACSSSLTALHLAAQAIERGECAAALVGGVNLYLHPSRLLLLREFGFLSPDGRCRSFGSGGTGFGPGEGVGAVVVKPLEKALADGDQVYAVVRGTAVGHAGRSHGYTAPSPRAQARVIRRALERAGVDPSTVGLVEAHGTGTELGDPIEVAALTEVFGERAGTAPIALGSVKSQIGHGESVAGLAALTKTVLQLRHRELLPTLHTDTVNPALDLSAGPFALATEHAPWPAPGEPGDPGGRDVPRRAGVSSFGAGGVNTHAVVEEYDPARARCVPARRSRPFRGRGGTDPAPGAEPSASGRPGRSARCLAGRRRRARTVTDLHDLRVHVAQRTGRPALPAGLHRARTVAGVAPTLWPPWQSAGARAGAQLPAGVHVNDVRAHAADAESFEEDAALPRLREGALDLGQARTGRPAVGAGRAGAMEHAAPGGTDRVRATVGLHAPPDLGGRGGPGRPDSGRVPRRPRTGADTHHRRPGRVAGLPGCTVGGPSAARGAGGDTIGAGLPGDGMGRGRRRGRHQPPHRPTAARRGTAATTTSSRVSWVSCAAGSPTRSATSTRRAP